MTPRSIRRAAERKAKKAALKAQRHAAPELFTQLPSSESEHLPNDLCPTPADADYEDQFEPALFAPAPLSNDEPAPVGEAKTISKAQLAANRSNAQFSSGPISPEGKAKSSLNAVKTALTGRTVLLPTDQAAEYDHHLRAYQDDFRPARVRECDLVQSIADTAWRLKRIPGLEAAIFAQGHIEFAESFNQHDASLRASMIEVQTFIKYEKQLRNLQLQESRLARRREKEIAELRELQGERKEKEREALEAAAHLYLRATESNQPFEPIVVNGFVFSTGQIEQHLAASRSRIGARTASAISQNRSGDLQKTAKQAA